MLCTKLRLTIDEQLFPCKTRCPFIQYMANKPDKFGIKFWLLADAQSKYLCNGKPTHQLTIFAKTKIKICFKCDCGLSTSNGDYSTF